MNSKLPTFSQDATGIIPIDEFLFTIQSTELPIVTNTKKISYYNVPAAFDIETSSFYQDGEKKSCMYIWQFGILNWVTCGRTWTEFKIFISLLSKILCLDEDLILPVYVHNLAYEFQFMRKQLKWDSVFFLEERKPVYARTGGVEFRCSLKLSSKSLEKVGKDLHKYKVEKKVGDLDYSLIRTSKTPIDETELGYCENDIRVLLAYIQEKIETDGNISRIPMTNTGYVRNFCRKECFKKYRQYRNLMSELTVDPSEYSQLKRGFQGGFTHASAKYSGRVIESVGSFDFTSSYPAVMLCEKFPMSKAKIIEKIKSEEEFKYYLNNYCCLFDVTFYDIIPKVDCDHPISLSKTINCKNPVVDNGRIVTAEELTITCTEQDFFVYSEFYNWSNYTIRLFRIYEKAYLPKPFVQAILQMYKNKTELKGVEGEEINYMISKNMLNASYGMAVTDIVRNEITYENNEYRSTKPDIDEAIDKYNNGGKRFLFYPWGVWVTAYARANLFSGILACGDDYIYSDTDSIKVRNYQNHMKYIEAYNNRVSVKLKRAADFHNLDANLFSPSNKKGIKKPIGVWDFEGIYDRFKTIGAKRYMTERNGQFSLTVAGVNKVKAMKYIEATFDDPFEGLTDKLIVPSNYSGRMTLTYIDEEIHGYVRDYLGNIGEYHELSCIHMEQSDYELTLSAEYKEFLNKVFGIKEDSW